LKTRTWKRDKREETIIGSLDDRFMLRGYSWEDSKCSEYALSVFNTTGLSQELTNNSTLGVKLNLLRGFAPTITPVWDAIIRKFRTENLYHNAEMDEFDAEEGIDDWEPEESDTEEYDILLNSIADYFVFTRRE